DTTARASARPSFRTPFSSACESLTMLSLRNVTSRSSSFAVMPNQWLMNDAMPPTMPAIAPPNEPPPSNAMIRRLAPERAHFARERLELELRRHAGKPVFRKPLHERPVVVDFEHDADRLHRLRAFVERRFGVLFDDANA